MKKVLCALAVFIGLSAVSHAAWWMENDYAFGSNNLKKESLTLFTRITPRLMSGANASFYKDGGLYRDKAYSFRLPIMYSPRMMTLSVTPFIYPSSPEIRSDARGVKAYALIPVSEDADESYIHLTLSAAAARQRTRLNNLKAETFSETAYEARVEKSFFNQFFFLVSAAGFTKPAKASRDNLFNPVLDHGDLADMGTLRPVTRLPGSVITAQFARNMAPDFDSYLYAGFSRISFRGANDANSLLGGLKMKLNDKTTMDFAYNYYKMAGEAGKNYYKLFFQIFF